jgi:hypothetical protein
MLSAGSIFSAPTTSREGACFARAASVSHLYGLSDRWRPVHFADFTGRLFRPLSFCTGNKKRRRLTALSPTLPPYGNTGVKSLRKPSNHMTTRMSRTIWLHDGKFFARYLDA